MAYVTNSTCIRIVENVVKVAVPITENTPTEANVKMEEDDDLWDAANTSSAVLHNLIEGEDIKISQVKKIVP